MLHIAAIALFAVAAFYTFCNNMPFTGVLCLLFLGGFGANLYRMQMIQISLMRQLTRNIHSGDTSVSFRSPYRNRALEEMTEELREAMRIYRLRTMEANELENWQKLLRVMGHEVMNSITPIISLSETLSTRPVDAESYGHMKHGMQVIHKRSKGLLEFVENYRRITRIPAPVKEKVSVNSLLQDMKNLFPDKCIHFSNLASDITVGADRAQIEQVLINLIKNAVEACAGSSSPKICIEASVAGPVTGSGLGSGTGTAPGSGSSPGTVSISVSDNGPGILPNVLEQIFIPFFSTKEGGSGIGLSLCRRIMHLHGGSLTAQSTPGAGSRFTLVF